MLATTTVLDCGGPHGRVGKVAVFQRSKSFDHLTAVSGVGSSQNGYLSTSSAMTFNSITSTSPDDCLFVTSLDYVSHVGKCLYLRVKSLFFYLHDVMKTVGGAKIP